MHQSYCQSCGRTYSEKHCKHCYYYTLDEWFSIHPDFEKNKQLDNRVRLAKDLVKFIEINHSKKNFLHNRLSTRTIRICKRNTHYHFLIKSCEDSLFDLDPSQLATTLENNDSKAIADILLFLVLPELGGKNLKTNVQLGLTDFKNMSQRYSLDNLNKNINEFSEIC